jgi:hypothetical protein
MRQATLVVGAVVLSTVRIWAADGTDLEGARVRVQTTGGVRLVGVVADADADTLTIQASPHSGVSRVARADVLGLEVSRGVRRWEPVPSSAVSLKLSPRRRGVQAEVVLAF